MRNTKKIISLIVIAFLLLIIKQNVFASSNLIIIEDVVKYSNIETVSLEIKMESLDTPLSTLGLDVKYDSSKLEFISAKPNKKINTNMRLAENVIDECRVAIGMVSLDGFQDIGVYYTVTFKVLDDSKDILVDLSLREACDKNGNAIIVETKGGKIKISDKETKIKEEKSPENQTIKSFEDNEAEKVKNLNDFIEDNGEIQIASQDNFEYEVEKDDIIEILDDGTMFPVSEGETNIIVKLNDDIIGNVKVKVEGNNIVQVATTDEISEDGFLDTTQQEPDSLEENVDTDDENIQDNIITEEKLADLSKNEVETKLINNEKNLNSSNKLLNRESKKIYIVLIGIIIIIVISIIIIKKYNKKIGR